MMKVVVLVLAVITLVAGQKFDFTGYRLVRLTPTQQEHVALIGGFEGKADVC